ncbi:MAG: hypothetical protein Q9164_006919 [Protoblastenia rupestris]
MYFRYIKPVLALMFGLNMVSPLKVPHRIQTIPSNLAKLTKETFNFTLPTDPKPFSPAKFSNTFTPNTPRPKSSATNKTSSDLLSSGQNELSFYDNVKNVIGDFTDRFPDAKLCVVMAFPVSGTSSSFAPDFKEIQVKFQLPSLGGWAMLRSNAQSWGDWDPKLYRIPPLGAQHHPFEWSSQITMDLAEAGTLVLAAGYRSPWSNVGIANVAILGDLEYRPYYIFTEKNTPPEMVFVRQTDRAVIPLD